MAKYWNIAERTLHTRLITKHMTIKDALTTPVRNTRSNRTWKDHIGNTFSSKTEMCKHWNISPSIYTGRIKLGWSIKDALTEPPDRIPKSAKSVTDHTGKNFRSVSEMCRYWNIPRSTYNMKIKHGKTIEEALTEPCETVNMSRQEWTDHNGITYPSLNAMCRAHGISHHTFKTRLTALGWSVKDALTKDQVISSVECVDINGNKFPTKRDMANYYCIPDYRLHGEKSLVENFEKILTTSWLCKKQIGDVIIKKLITYPYFLVTYHDYDYIFDVDAILNLYHNHESFTPLPDSKVTDDTIRIIKCTGFPNYMVCYNGDMQEWSYWDIISYRHDTNFGLSRKDKT